MESRKWIGAGRFDSSDSYFKHKIVLENNYELIGYSKSLLSRESPDKIVMLEKMILRLVNNGYLFGKHKKYETRTTRIEYYLNGKFTGEPDELVFILMPDKYELVHSDYLTDVRLITFLKRLYTQAKEGKLINKSLAHKPKVKLQLNINVKSFASEPELYNWMVSKIKEGFAPGEVKNFYFKYREKWLVNA